MSNIRISPVATKYGLIFGLLNVGIYIAIFEFYLIQYIANQNLASLVTIVPFLALQILCFWEYRKLNGGYLPYVTALKVGSLMAFVASATQSIIKLGYSIFVGEEHIANSIRFVQESLTADGVPAEEIDAALEMIVVLMQPDISFFFDFIGGIATGFVFSLITGVIMRKERPKDS